MWQFCILQHEPGCGEIPGMNMIPETLNGGGQSLIKRNRLALARKTSRTDRCCKRAMPTPSPGLVWRGQVNLLRPCTSISSCGSWTGTDKLLPWEPYRHLRIPQLLSECFTHHPSNLKKILSDLKEKQAWFIFSSANAGIPAMLWHPIQGLVLPHTRCFQVG